MAKPVIQDPFGLVHVARACEREGTYFSVVAEFPGPGAHFFKVYDANRDVVYSGTRNQVTIFLESLKTGCLIGLGKAAVVRQKTLFGTMTKAPQPTKQPVPRGQQRLY